MKKEITSGIYCIENMVNGKKYIGQGINIERRMFQHHDNSHILNNAIKKYGKENFNIYVLEYCSREELNVLEIKYIKEHGSHVSIWGYNVSWGGNQPLIGISPSLETRKKISDAKMGHSVSEETKKLIKENRRDYSGKNNPMWGKHHSEEARKKIRDANLGRQLSDEIRKKISDGETGENNANFGKKFPNASSKYFGVYKRERGKYIYWICNVSINRKKIIIGNYKTELEAAKEYDKYIIENNLPNPLNFPEDHNQ
jgi:group I intron endonuclease